MARPYLNLNSTSVLERIRKGRLNLHQIGWKHPLQITTKRSREYNNRGITVAKKVSMNIHYNVVNTILSYGEQGMVKIRVVLFAVLFSFITIFVGTNTVTAQNVVTTIDLNPESNISVLPLAMNLNPLNNRLYVYTTDENAESNKIVVIDSISYDVITTIMVPDYNSTFKQIAINPEIGRIYVASPDRYYGDKIYVIDENTNKIINTITIENGIEEIAINRVTDKIYVVNNKKVTVTVIDGDSNKKIDIIKLQDNSDLIFKSGGIKVNPFTNRIYVLKNSTQRKLPKKQGILNNSMGLPRAVVVSLEKDTKEKKIVVIDGSTNSVIDTINLNFATLANVIDPHITNFVHSRTFFGNAHIVGPSIYKIEINPLTNRVYIYVHIHIYEDFLELNSEGINTLLIIDGPTNKIIEAINISRMPGGSNMIIANTRTNRIYLTNQENNRLKVIDANSHRVVSEIKIGYHPFSISIDLYRNLLYITYKDSGTIDVIQIDSPPKALTVYPESAVYTSSFQDAIVTLLDQNRKPLPGVEVKASTNDQSATVFPPAMVTNNNGMAVFRFRFKFNSGTEEDNNLKITFTANQQETSITNDE